MTFKFTAFAAHVAAVIASMINKILFITNKSLEYRYKDTTFSRPRVTRVTAICTRITEPCLWRIPGARFAGGRGERERDAGHDRDGWG